MMKWNDGATYEGEWIDGMAFGFGRFTHINGDSYFGEWKNDKANGWGIFVKTDKNDSQGGSGVM